MKQFFITLGILAVGVSYAPFVWAATLSVTTDNAAPAISQPIHVDVVLDTQGEDINAIQGRILFPADLFTLQSISDGASPVTFWVDSPSEIASGVILFSGIVPGGFTGTANSVVSLVLDPIASGKGTIRVASATLLRNDGKGSSIALTTTNRSVAISSSHYSGPSLLAVDTFPPEPFTPVVAHDQDIYGGQYFLVFGTADKGSGIDHYDVVEVPAGRALDNATAWQTAESPYLLHDQSLSNDVYVRAVDRMGNAIVEKLPSPHAHLSFMTLTLIVLAFVVLLLGLRWWRGRGRRRRIRCS